MASTYGCIRVTVGAGRLSIHPRWLIRLFTVPLLLDLDHDVELSDIIETRELGRWYGYAKVSIRYRHPSGEPREVLIYSKRGTELLQTLHGASCPD